MSGNKRNPAFNSTTPRTVTLSMTCGLTVFQSLPCFLFVFSGTDGRGRVNQVSSGGHDNDFHGDGFHPVAAGNRAWFREPHGTWRRTVYRRQLCNILHAVRRACLLQGPGKKDSLSQYHNPETECFERTGLELD